MIGRIGRPGLLGLAARTAVVAGTATAVSTGVARYQQRKAQAEYEAEQYEAAQRAIATPAPAPAPRPEDATTAQLLYLVQQRSAGALTDAEFKAATEAALNPR